VEEPDCIATAEVKEALDIGAAEGGGREVVEFEESAVNVLKPGRSASQGAG
jgi:hypothetical protein